MNRGNELSKQNMAVLDKKDFYRSITPSVGLLASFGPKSAFLGYL